MAKAKVELERLISVYEMLGNVKLVGEDLGVDSSSVYRRLKKAGVIPDMKRLEKVVVDGVSYSREKQGYLRATRLADRKDTKKARLHRAVASRTQDIIGKDVHHDNGDKACDDPENLKVMSRPDHIRHQKTKQDQHPLS